MEKLFVREGAGTIILAGESLSCATRMPRTIRWKLILSISIPLLVTYLGMLGWDYYRQRTAAMTQMQQAVLERAENAAGHIQARLAAVAQVAESTAALVESRPNVTEAQLRTIVQTAQRQTPWIAVTAVALEPRGKGGVRGVVARRGMGGPPRTGEPPGTVTSRDWYVNAKREGRGVWTGPHREVGGDERIVCTYSMPIMVGDAFAGVAAASVVVEELRRVGPGPDRGGPRTMRDRMDERRSGDRDRDRDRDGGDRPGERLLRPQSRPADDTEAPPAPPTSPATAPSALDAELGFTQPLRDFAILDGGGHVIVAPPDAPAPPKESIFQIATTLGRHELADAARDALAGESRVVRVAGLHEVIGTVTTDTYHWIALAPIPSTGWALISVIPESETMAPILARIAQRGAFLLGGTVVLLMVVMLVSIRISRPIEQMAGAVDRLAAGDLDAQVTGITSRDELGRLAGGFNQMTRQLKAHVAEITQQTAAREKVESELRIARQIQTDMLPRTFPPFPERPEFELHAVNLPALRVAGDFYDFFFTPEGLLTAVIADVSGKGVPAALLMAVTRTIVRNFAQAGLGPAQIAERTNRMLIEDTSGGMFVTMLLIQYDPATGHLAYVNAGHPPAYRISADDAQSCCRVQSPLLGVDASGEMGPFEQREMSLAAGESLFLYTDGVTEARAQGGSMYGDAALQKALRRHAGLSPRELCREMAEVLEQFQAGHRHDDITLLVLQRSGTATR